jgi:hypothetical protein
MTEPAPSRQLGRPTKLNTELLRRLVEMYRLGASQADACRYAGVSPDALQRWLKAGRAELAAIEAQPEGEYDVSDCAALALAIDRAQGEFVKDNLENIRTHSQREWPASAWLLERRFPDDWGKREKVDHTHVLVQEAARIAKARGLDAESTAKIVDFVVQQAKRGRRSG